MTEAEEGKPRAKTRGLKPKNEASETKAKSKKAAAAAF
jgi:hypothetical protein